MRFIVVFLLIIGVALAGNCTLDADCGGKGGCDASTGCCICNPGCVSPQVSGGCVTTDQACSVGECLICNNYNPTSHLAQFPCTWKPTSYNIPNVDPDCWHFVNDVAVAAPSSWNVGDSPTRNSGRAFTFDGQVNLQINLTVNQRCTFILGVSCSYPFMIGTTASPWLADRNAYVDNVQTTCKTACTQVPNYPYSPVQSMCNYALMTFTPDTTYTLFYGSFINTSLTQVGVIVVGVPAGSGPPPPTNTVVQQPKCVDAAGEQCVNGAGECTDGEQITCCSASTCRSMDSQAICQSAASPDSYCECSTANGYTGATCTIAAASLPLLSALLATLLC